MKKIFKIQVLGLTLMLLVFGCNSTVYEIEEIEEKVEISTTPADTNILAQNNNEIKEDLKSESKIPDNKFTDKQVVARIYSVQIGAFLNEDNASNFTQSAKKQIDQSVYYKKYDGLYKVRFGSYNSVSEAINILEKLKNMGYSDSFVVELTYVQSQEK